MTDTYLVKKNDLTTVADAIRTASATSTELEFPAGFSEAIEDQVHRASDQLRRLVRRKTRAFCPLPPNCLTSKVFPIFVKQLKGFQNLFPFKRQVISENSTSTSRLFSTEISTRHCCCNFLASQAKFPMCRWQGPFGRTTRIQWQRSPQRFWRKSKNKTTTYIRNALGQADLELTYSNPVHVSMQFNNKNGQRLT